ncbi:MAG: hypothetical protein A2Y69_02945 [Candidatus Aminicenantes bacterium RBG_13_59_9]|nr:MAG: hypothetical protein A2Y69_02945 [Candidatus Aminicenantes bacterium RBG_13_59_9]
MIASISAESALPSVTAKPPDLSSRPDSVTPPARPGPPLPSPVETLAPGSIFGGQYKVIKELGEGKTGKVYKVFDQAMERELALRLFKPELVKDLNAQKRFFFALKSIRPIVQKNVIRMFEFREEKGQLVLTMEYFPGRNLKTYLGESEPLTAEKVIAIAAEIVSGLAAAHGAGIAHFDLKPGNILIDKDGRVKITDLGLASAFFPKGTDHAGVILGTPEYMSPEQIQGQDPDPQSDLYSTGVILYEMATGRTPFSGDTPSEVCEKHLKETPRNPRELNPRIPPALSLLILKCLEKEKGKRFQTARELRSGLAEIEERETKAGRPAAETAATSAAPQVVDKKAVPVSVKPRSAKKKKIGAAPKMLFIPALIVLAVVILGLIMRRPDVKSSGGQAPLPSAPGRLTIAVIPFRNLSPSQEYESWGEGIAVSLSEALAGVQGLRIPDADSLLFLRSRGWDSREIGSRVNAAYRLEADFRLEKNSLRLTAKLLNQSDGSTVWFKEYDRPREALFAVPEEIALEIIRTLKIPGSGEGPLPSRSAPKNFDAFGLYWQGKRLLHDGGKENIEKSISCFKKAAEKDPSFALADMGLAQAYAESGRHWIWPPEQAFPRAKSSALNALLKNANLSEARALLASIKDSYEWDRQGAEKDYKEAIRLKPGGAAAHHCYALFLSRLGRHEEAISEIRLSQDLDPLSPEISAHVGAVLYFARQSEQALGELAKTLLRDPLNQAGHFYTGLVKIQLLKPAEALESFRRAGELGGNDLEISLHTAYIYSLSGQRADAGRLLTEAIKAAKAGYISSVNLAAVYAGVGERDQAFACLEKALSEHDPELAFLKVHPFFDSVQGDRRFTDILKRIGLSD